MATRKQIELSDGRTFFGGYDYGMAEWVNFLCNNPQIPSHIENRLKPLIDVFTEISVKRFDRFIESKGLERDDFDDMCDDRIAYLSFTTLVGHGVGFWSEAMSYQDNSKQTEALTEYSDLVKTLEFPDTCEIEALMYDADPDNEEYEKNCDSEYYESLFIE